MTTTDREDSLIEMYAARKITSEFFDACFAHQDAWVPGSGGNEKPFAMRGRRLMYCYNPGQHKHAYYDCDTDIVLTDAEYHNIQNEMMMDPRNEV